MKWRGVPISIAPNDLFVIQDVLHDKEPDIVIETGTFFGGSAIYFASHMKDSGLVITIDVVPLKGRIFQGPEKVRRAEDDPLWKHVRTITGRSDDSSVLAKVEALIKTWSEYHGKVPRVMVSLDGPHLCNDVLKEMTTMSRFVTPDQYLLVQDTKMDHGYLHFPTTDYHGHNGPLCAVRRFFGDHLHLSRDFVVDRRREYLGTQHTMGWLLKNEN